MDGIIIINQNICIILDSKCINTVFGNKSPLLLEYALLDGVPAIVNAERLDLSVWTIRYYVSGIQRSVFPRLCRSLRPVALTPVISISDIGISLCEQCFQSQKSFRVRMKKIQPEVAFSTATAVRAIA